MSYDILEILVEYLFEFGLIIHAPKSNILCNDILFRIDRIVSCLCMIETLKINNSLEAYDAQQKKIKYLKL